MARVLSRARHAGITHVAFGDLFLEDVRDYRVRQLKGTGLEPMFPLWREPSATPDLARSMLAGGIKAVLTCIDTHQLAVAFLGRTFDSDLLRDLPARVDPCGERGEFHSFCFSGPMFRSEIPVVVGQVVRSGQFEFIDVLPAGSHVGPDLPAA